MTAAPVTVVTAQKRHVATPALQLPLAKGCTRQVDLTAGIRVDGHPASFQAMKSLRGAKLVTALVLYSRECLYNPSCD